MNKVHKEIHEKIKTFDKMATNYGESVDMGKEEKELHKIVEGPKMLYSDIVKNHKESAVRIKEEIIGSKGDETTSDSTRKQKFQENKKVCKKVLTF